MKTYRDLIEYAFTLPKIYFEGDDCNIHELEHVFELSYCDLETVEDASKISKVAIVRDPSGDGYYYDVLYYIGYPFAIFSYDGDDYYNETHILDELVWKTAKKYALSLVKEKEEEVKVVDLDSYIRPQYGDKYPWEFLSEEHQPEFYMAQCTVTHPMWNSNNSTITLSGFGYEEGLALVDLNNQLARWKAVEGATISDITIELIN